MAQLVLVVSPAPVRGRALTPATTWTGCVAVGGTGVAVGGTAVGGGGWVTMITGGGGGCVGTVVAGGDVGGGGCVGGGGGIIRSSLRLGVTSEGRGSPAHREHHKCGANDGESRGHEPETARLPRMLS